MRPKIDFLYLNEEDTIKAGVKDFKRCIEVMDEMFKLLGEGDYLMGGANHNSHGIKIYFPEKTEFENMPVKGPDRRFMSLVAYLGGRFNVCGQKWYGSNINNKEKELPRSILTCMLNDPETGQPIVHMSANILSSVRTGAIPGVAAKYMAKKSSEVFGVIGAGVIGSASAKAVLTTCKNIKLVKIFDVYEEASQKFLKEIESEFDVNVIIVNTLEDAIRHSDILNFATAGEISPKVESDWIKDGVLMLMPGSAEFEKDYFIDQTIVVDNWKMYEAYREEQGSIPGTFSQKNSGICGYLMDYVFEGDIPLNKVISLGDVIAGKHVGRKNDEENIIFITDGMGVEDVAWAYEVYQNAVKNNIGVKLNLF